MAEFDFSSSDWELLRNVATDPVRQLIAVEIDTTARARAAIDKLSALNPHRPSTTIELDAALNTADRLLGSAEQATARWTGNLGLILLTDVSQFVEDENAEARARDFWRHMNQLRERWDALDAQVIFFLLPGSYRMLTLHADHFKRWIALKIHLLGAEPDSDASIRGHMQQQSTGLLNFLSPDVAKEQIRRLEGELAEAIRRGVSKGTLARRYYLPMFEAAVSLHDLGRAASLRDKIDEKDFTESEWSAWLMLNCELSLSRFELNDASRFACTLKQMAEQTGNENAEAYACFNLGRIAQERREFEEARKWYLKSLAIQEKQGNDFGAAITYHELGLIAQERRDFEDALKWYLKSLAIKEKQGDTGGAAITYHQLGAIAQERRDFEDALKWSLKSLAISQKQGDQHNAAITYHLLGMIAQERRKFEDAEQWYLKSLAITKKQVDQHSAAITYHQLGTIAEARREFEDAEHWYLKSLAIKEKQGDTGGAATTYGQLGLFSLRQEEFRQAVQWTIKCTQAFQRTNDPYSVQQATDQFVDIFRSAPAEERPALAALWQEAGLAMDAIEGAELDVSQGEK